MQNKGPLQYAGFWKRLLASIWDTALIGTPAFFAFRYSLHSSLGLMLAWYLGGTSLLAVLNLYLLVRFGGTPGKLLLGIRVVQPDGSPIGWKNAVMRNSVDLVYTAYGMILLLAVLPRIDYALLSSLPFKKMGAYWRQVYPPWTYVVREINGWYGISEAFVMLTNKQRRAIHDFIGGTVVVVRSRAELQEDAWEHEPQRDSDA